VASFSEDLRSMTTQAVISDQIVGITEGLENSNILQTVLAGWTRFSALHCSQNFSGDMPWLQVLFRTLKCDRSEQQAADAELVHADKFHVTEDYQTLAYGFVFLVALAMAENGNDLSLEYKDSSTFRDEDIPTYIRVLSVWVENGNISSEGNRLILEQLFLGSSASWAHSNWNFSHKPTYDEIEGSARLMIDVIFDNGLNRRLFATAKGYIGLGPSCIEDNDLLCVIPGCEIPMIIRPEQDHHIIVGECYVQGMMDGEAIQMVESGQLPYSELTIL